MERGSYGWFIVLLMGCSKKKLVKMIKFLELYQAKINIVICGMKLGGHGWCMMSIFRGIVVEYPENEPQIESF